jgi:HAD superfamily hydrolase (TIGR01509 family)
MDAVLFDMDGVIVASEEHWQKLEAETVLPTAVASGDPDPDVVTGINYRESYDVLAESYEMAVDREEFESMYERVAEELYTDRAELNPGVEDLVYELRDRGLTVGLVSSAPRDWIELVVDRFERDAFDLVVSTEDIDAQGKPEPHVYEYAAAELGLEPADCLVVEDSENGVLAAARAGTYTIAFRQTHNADADLSAADRVVDSAEKLRAAILELADDGD